MTGSRRMAMFRHNVKSSVVKSGVRTLLQHIHSFETRKIHYLYSNFLVSLAVRTDKLIIIFCNNSAKCSWFPIMLSLFAMTSFGESSIFPPKDSLEYLTRHSLYHIRATFFKGQYDRCKATMAATTQSLQDVEFKSPRHRKIL